MLLKRYLELMLCFLPTDQYFLVANRQPLSIMYSIPVFIYLGTS